MLKFFTNRESGRLVAALLTVEFLWGAGFFLILLQTTVPAYLTSLGATPLVIGAMAVAVVALPMLPQIFGRAVIGRFPRRKRGIWLMHMAGIVLYLAVPLLDWRVRDSRGLLIAAFIGCLGLSQIIFGLINPVWLDMVAQVIPLPVRGRYFGVATALFGLGGVLGGVALLGLQHWLGEHRVFRGAFLAASACFLLSMAAFALAPIPESAFDHPREPPLLARLRQCLCACRMTTDFGHLAASFCAQTVATAILPFLVVYASSRDGLRLAGGIFAQITVWQALGGVAGAILLGWVIDHRGVRWPWVAVTLIVPVVVLLYPHAGWRPLLVLCSLLVGVITTHWSVAGPALLELSPEGDKSAYIATANLASLLPAILGPLLIGKLIEGPGYRTAFLVAALAGLVAAALALTIRGGPRRRGRHADVTSPLAD